ncbi:MAG: hypothetical protein AAF546_10800 [Verrucomicrobiota bacterium]
MTQTFRKLFAYIFLACSPAIAQEVILSIDFESVTPGPGALSDLSPSFTTFLTGDTIASGVDPATDPQQGVLATSLLGTGPAGYVGGPNTNVQFNAGLGSFFLLTFPGSPSDTAVYLKGSAQSQRVISIDFAIERSTNTQGYAFHLFDAQGEATPQFQYHSYIYILSNNAIYYQDNLSEAFTDSGLSITPNTPYRLTYYVDYDCAKWTAYLTNLNDDSLIPIVSDRELDYNAFTLSGWTTAQSLDIRTYTQNFDLTQPGVFGDRMVFDNYVAAIQAKDSVEITAFNYDSSNGTVTLSWDSETGATYSIRYTEDLTENFDGNLVCAINSGGTTTTYGPIASPIPNATKLFFQVGKD